MSDIFLSYKSEDKDKAQIITEALVSEGFSVWWDRVIPAGRKFDEVIEEELDASKCVVVLWSEKSVKSDWVKEEAEEGRRVLVPVLIDDVKPPLGFRRIQAANLVNWKGAPDHPEFSLLLQSVAGIVRSSTMERVESPYPNENEIEKSETKDEQEKKITNYIDMQFKLIPTGEFMMGSGEYEDEGPEHKVTIDKPFYLGIHPVTQLEWKAVMGNNPSNFKGDNLPVETVYWNDAQEFISKLNEMEGTEKYRLPSEAEWEYAARAGTTTRYSFGDDESRLGEYAWYADNSEDKTHVVGQKKPNPWGLYDMHGNVLEWVQDWYHSDYKNAPTDGSAWESEGGSARFGRGGGWYGFAQFCRSAFRFYVGPGNRSSFVGFRLLRKM